MKKLISAVVMLGVLTTGCSRYASQIPPAPYPADRYEGLTCAELDQEANHIVRDTKMVEMQQDATARKDTTGVALGILILPIFFVMCIGGEHKDELAALKGKTNALIDNMEAKHCDKELRYMPAKYAGAVAVGHDDEDDDEEFY